MKNEMALDVTDAQGVAINYATLRAFNEHFHRAFLPPFERASDEEQAAATSSYIWVRDHPEVSARQMHTDWIEQMVAMGWKAGPEFSEDDQVHPHMKPWEELPRWARRMLHLTIAQIHILSAEFEELETVMGGADQ